ncbi:unnamed protein product [Prunus armeniaca]
MRRCLERQMQELKKEGVDELKKKRVQQEDDEQVAMAMGMLDLSSQGRRRGSQVGHGSNFDRHRHSRVMHDVCNYDAYFVQKCDVAGVLGLLPELLYK